MAPPTISAIANQSINLNTSTTALAFTVADDVTTADALTVTGASSNTALVPNSNIILGGTGGQRTVTVTPNTRIGGNATITLTVTDGGDLFSSTSFVLSVYNSPTISSIPNQIIAVSTPSRYVPFTVADSVNPAAALTVAGASSNTALIPNANVTFFVSPGGVHYVKVTPVAGLIGTTTIMLVVTNGGGLTTATFFTVTVTTPPAITAVANQTIIKGASTSALAFTVSEALTQASTLTVACASRNSALFPAANIVLVGPNAQGNCTVTLSPVAAYSGISTITLSVTDSKALTATTSFTITVYALPTITSIANQVLASGAATAALPFTVGDTVTPVASLTVTKSSSNTTLVPTANIVLAGTGASRTVKVTTAAGQSGSSTITLTVTNGGSRTATTSFTVAVNAPPTITTIANQEIAINAPTPALSFIVGDAVTPAASLTVTGASSNTTLVPTANIAFGGSGASRTVTVTPVTGKSGVTTITLTVTDAGARTTTTSFTVSVEPPPTITTIANQTIASGASTPILAFTLGDLDDALTALTVTGASSNTTLAPTANIVFGGSGASRTVMVVPVTGQSGVTTITLTVTNTDGQSATTSFTVTVNSVLPTITPIANQNLPMGTPSSALAFTVGGSAVPASSLIVTGTSSNTALVPVSYIFLSGSGASRFTTIVPMPAQSGVTTITLTVSDGNNHTATTSFTVTVNVPPTITAIANQTLTMGSASSALSFTVGDTVTPVAALTVSASSSNVTLVPTANVAFGGSGASRTVLVVPVAGRSGSAIITLTVKDNGGLTSSTSFTVTVYAPPTISTIANQNMTMGTAASALSFTVGDTVTPVAALSVTGTSSKSTLVPNGNIVFGGSGASRTVTVTPLTGQSGVTTITLTVTNGGGLTATMSFSLTVYSPPTITSIANQTLTIGASTSALSFTVGDTVTPVASLSVTGASSNSTLAPVSNIVFGGSGASRTVMVVPATGQSGTTTITLTVTDNASLSTSTSFVVTVNAPPTISTIANQNLSAGSATSALPFIVGDTVTPVSALAMTGTSSNATLVPIANIVFGGSGATRSVTVTPATGQSGTTTITLTVMNNAGLTATTSFVVTVNAPPTITSITNQTLTIGAATPALSFTVGDTVTPVTSLTVTGSSSNITLVPTTNIVFNGSSASRTVTVLAAAGQSGLATITLTVTDDGGLSASTSFVVTVYSPPSISAIADQSLVMNSSSPALSFTVGDAVTPASALTVSGVALNTSLLPTANIVFGGSGASRTVMVTPANGQSGSTKVTLTVMNGASLTATTSFYITVNAAPTITAIANQTINLGASTSALSFTVGDAVTPVTALTVAGVSSNTTLVPTANIIFGGSGASRTVSVTTAAGQSGITTITLTVTDNASLTATTSFTVTVTAAPTITTIADQTSTVGSPTGPLSFVVGDAVTPVNALSVSGASSNTTLVPTANIAFGGSGASRTVLITPAAGISGTTTITLTVTNGSGLTATSSFALTVSQLNPIDGASLVWVPGGTFTMGTNFSPLLDTLPYTQQVTLSGYWIYTNEVTVAEYRAFCAATGHALPPFPTPDVNNNNAMYSWTGLSDWTAPALQQMPIVDVTWNDAQAYATWAGATLPTEAQYEWAASGPNGNNFPWGGTATATDNYNGFDETNLKIACGWNSANLGISTWPVGSFPAGVSWCGAMDMSGNVWEWCADWYGPYSTNPLTNPTGPTTGTSRCVRGGSWSDQTPELYDRCSTRNQRYPTGFWTNYGFRCVTLLTSQ